MKISVLMSAFNAEKYISQAIESILKQTCDDFEFIILNDGSTDKTREIIQNYTKQDKRIRLINNNKNFGLTRSLNIGLEEARGKYIARIDADDLSEPERLQKQYEFMEANPEYALAGSWVKIIDSEGREMTVRKLPTDIKLIKFNFIFGKPCLWHSSIFFRKEEMDKVGNYDEEYKYSQDLNLYVRLLKTKKITNVPEFLIQHRLHSNSIGKNNSEAQHSFYLKAIHELINNYYHISREELELRDRARNQKINKLKDLKIALKIDKKIYINFLVKEKLDEEQVREAEKTYNRKKIFIIKGYFKNKLPKLYQWLKNK
ncbi:glycosyltransferase family 2 protein [Candidatus Kuenenbacteria bacterium]|nr:glycosyltransferase family 2 protein [Candidatus Kuenenbacteria bacterium]